MERGRGWSVRPVLPSQLVFVKWTKLVLTRWTFSMTLFRSENFKHHTLDIVHWTRLNTSRPSRATFQWKWSNAAPPVAMPLSARANSGLLAVGRPWCLQKISERGPREWRRASRRLHYTERVIERESGEETVLWPEMHCLECGIVPIQQTHTLPGLDVRLLPRAL